MTKTTIPVSTIDSSIPIPDRGKYPLEQLEVGESFVVTEDRRQSVQSRASRVKASTGKVFTVRKTVPGEVRVWRVK